MENKYLIFDEENDIYDIDRQALFTFLLSQGFDEDIAEQWLEDDDEFTESVINSFDDLEEATEDDIEEWATTEMEFYSKDNGFLNENKMTNEQLRMQMLSGIITEGEYKAKLEENKKPKSKKPLKENFVGIGAINNPFLEREKTDYEMAFEHFTKGSLSENEEEDEIPRKSSKIPDDTYIGDDTWYEENDVEEDTTYSDTTKYAWKVYDFLKEMFPEVGEDERMIKILESAIRIIKSSNLNEIALEKTPLDENTVGTTVDKILQTFEFSQKGNDEMIEFGEYLLSPEGPKNIAMTIKSRLKGEGGEKYFTSDPEKLQAFLSKLR